MVSKTVVPNPAAAVVAVALALVASGCSAGEPSADKCQTVSAPLSDVPSRTDQEPKLRVPVPAGWERTTEMDNQDIRFAIRNKGLAADGFTPNAVVTLQKVPSDLGRPEQILNAQNEQIAKALKVDDMNSTETEVCGVPAVSTSYVVPEAKISPKIPTIPPRTATSLGAVYRTGDTNYVAMLTVQSVKPDDKTYAADAEMILNGFQLLPPN